MQGTSDSGDNRDPRDRRDDRDRPAELEFGDYNSEEGINMDNFLDATDRRDTYQRYETMPRDEPHPGSLPDSARRGSVALGTSMLSGGYASARPEDPRSSLASHRISASDVGGSATSANSISETSYSERPALPAASNRNYGTNTSQETAPISSSGHFDRSDSSMIAAYLAAQMAAAARIQAEESARRRAEHARRRRPSSCPRNPKNGREDDKSDRDDNKPGR